jgi:tight adherence protein B
MILWIAFFAMVLLIFCMLAVTTKPTADQAGMSARIAAIKAASGGLQRPDNELDRLLRDATAGNFGWLEERLQRFPFAQTAQLFIMQADSKTTVGMLFVSSIGLFVAVFALVWLLLSSLPVALVAAGFAGYVPIFLLSMRRKKRIDAFNKGLPDAADTMSRTLRAGHSMIAAIGIVAESASEPLRSEFAEVFRKQNFGVPVRDAMLQLLERMPSQDLRVVVTGILIQKETGGNLAEILDRTAAVIRERVRIHGEIRTHTAQGRMTGWILCLLPLVMMALINIVDPGYSTVLFRTASGRMYLYIGGGLLILGAFAINYIVSAIEV